MSIQNINQLKESEYKIKETEKRFKNITYTIADYMYSVIFKSTGVTETIHMDQCKAITGYSPIDYELDKYLWINMVHPEDRMIVKRISDNALFGIESPQIEHRIIHKDGSVRWISNTIVIRRNLDGTIIGYDGIIKDITDRKNIEEKLIYQALLLENISDAVISTDMNFLVQSINIAGEEMFGWNVEEVINSNFFSLFEYNAPSETDIIDCINKKGFWKGEVTHFRPEYNHYIISMTVKFIKNRFGINSGLIFICHDITEQKIIEENKKNMNEKFLEIDKMTSLGLLVSGVAHEINNPNQYILSNIEILNESFKNIAPILDEYYNDYGDFFISGLSYNEMKSIIPDMFNKILVSSKSIKNIIDELKSYIKKDSYFDKTPVDLNTIVSASIELLNGMIKKSSNKINVKLYKTPVMVIGSYQKYEQVIINLIQNACQSLTDSSQSVWIETGFRENGFVFIEIKDEGCGISSDAMKNLAIPFFTTKRDSGGTGLGLYVSNNIVRSYGGVLDFKSDSGKGTTVTILLPGDFK